MTKKIKDNLKSIGVCVGIGATILACEYLALIQFSKYGWL